MIELVESETYDLVVCSECWEEYPEYDVYETTREHPMGEDRYLCPGCASRIILSRMRDREDD